MKFVCILSGNVTAVLLLHLIFLLQEIQFSILSGTGVLWSKISLSLVTKKHKESYSMTIQSNTRTANFFRFFWNSITYSIQGQNHCYRRTTCLYLLTSCFKGFSITGTTARLGIHFANFLQAEKDEELILFVATEGFKLTVFPM